MALAYHTLLSMRACISNTKGYHCHKRVVLTKVLSLLVSPPLSPGSVPS